MFEPQNEIGIYLQVRQVFVDRNDHTQTSLKIERLPHLKVDSYLVWRLKLFMSTCSNNGLGNYKEDALNLLNLKGDQVEDLSFVKIKRKQVRDTDELLSCI